MTHYQMMCDDAIKLPYDQFDSNAAALITAYHLCGNYPDIHMMLEQFIGHAEAQYVLPVLAEFAEALAHETREFIKEKGITADGGFAEWYKKNYDTDPQPPRGKE